MRILNSILSIIMLSGCIMSLSQAQDDVTTLHESTTDNTTTPIREPYAIVPGAVGPYQYPEQINPLTGLAVDNPAILNRRPIIVKISNSPAVVRPQSGISEADLVFEHYTEVGITRFSAIFYSHTPIRVGSVRSARLIDYELVPMYQGLLAFAGASIGVDKRIYGSEAVIETLCSTRDEEDIEQCHAEAENIGPTGLVPPSEFANRAYKGVLYGQPYYYRDETIPIPHNLFVNLDALWHLAEIDGNSDRPDLHGLAFHELPQGTPSGSGIYAQVRYLTTLVEWHYDPKTALYYRSSDGQRHYDANTESQITAANVIIVYAGHYLTDIIESQYQDVIHWSTQITIWPQGDAVILRDGIRYDGRWLRASRPDMLTFETRDGELIYLKPGNTWIQLVPTPDQMDPEREWVVVE